MDIARRGLYFLIIFSAPRSAAYSAPSISILIKVICSPAGIKSSSAFDSTSRILTGASLLLYLAVNLVSIR